MSYKKFQVYFFVSVLIISAAFTLVVFRSYLTLLAFGGVLAIIARPLYRYLFRHLKSETAASFLCVIIISLTVLLPSAYFFAALSAELVDLFTNIKGYFDLVTLDQVLRRVLPLSLQANIPEVINEILGVLRGVVGQLSANLISLFSNLVNIFIGFIIIMIMVYYLLKDGTKIKKELLLMSPLGDEHDELVLQKVILAVRAVMNGVLIVGLIKGILAGLSFWIFGVPAPMFWGTMTGLASFLPIFGSALITVPMIVYLFLTGHMGAAIGLTVISLTIIGTIDNLLQPKLVESVTRIHPLLILLSILGGFEFYGFTGFILGPLTLAVTMALLDIYKKEFKNYVERV
jgi:predicted PurR-regulated permease PerM